MRKNLIIKFIKQNATLFALILIVLGLALADSAFFTPRNLSNLVRQVTIIGIMSVGMTMVILIGGIDLSVGSVAGLSAVAVTMLMQYGLSAYLAIPLTLALVGGFVGIWNALWISYYKIPPFIITLGMLTIARGLALTLSGGSSIPVSDPSFQVIGAAISHSKPPSMFWQSRPCCTLQSRCAASCGPGDLEAGLVRRIYPPWLWLSPDLA
jgi:D-xylose transport system permease protein